MIALQSDKRPCSQAQQKAANQENKGKEDWSIGAPFDRVL